MSVKKSIMRASVALAALSAAGVLGAGFAGPATAQTSPLFAPPPSNYSVDGNGVDLTSGQFVLSLTPVQIGQPGGSGIAYTRTYVQGLGWRDNVTGTLSSANSTYYVSIGPVSDVFTLSGGVFTPVRNIGQTLTLSGSTYTYTLPDGTIATFSGQYANRLLPPPAPGPQFEANRGRITQLRRPNGETLTYEYEVAIREIATEPNWWAIRLNRVANNYGYALEFAYRWPSYPNFDDVEDWRILETVTAVNQTTCGLNCPTGTVWPSATFTGSNIVDQSGRTTYYGLAGTSGRALRLPQNPTTNALTTAHDANGRVTAYSTGEGTWTYAHAEAGGVRTVTITDPSSGVTVARTNMANGLLTSIQDPLNGTTEYQYDASRRPTKVTFPKGNTVNYVYDARGNVTTAFAEAPPTSSEPAIITSATYPATCANRVTCNQPITTTDARGAVTDYAYDPVHGGVTKVTLPAPTAGAARPETRIAYGERHAWISNGAGGYVEVAAGITLPVSSSTCASGAAPACVDTAHEVETTITYGATGVANNLNPTVVAQGAGDGSLTATTTLTYTNRGDIASVDGPLPGASDTVTYRHDDNRQVVGVIAPDPDGAGPRLRRAIRNTYNADDAVTLTEQGVVTGLTDPNWAAFVSLQKASVTYDAYGRPTHERLQSGAGATSSVRQISYDASGRVSCSAVRMNPAAYAALPASACTAATAGAFGPDRISQTTYDALGRPSSTTSAYGTADAQTESVTYTPNGRVASLTDGRNNVSVMEYDGFDRLVKLRYPKPTGGGTSTTDYEQYGYDAYGRPANVRNRNGETTHFGFDALNRLTAVNFPGSMADISSAYDNLGRKTVTGDGTTTQATAYDALSRVVSEATSGLGSMTFGYDAASRMTSIQWPDGFKATYDHDVSGAITGINQVPSGGSASPLVGYVYNDQGQTTAVSRASGAGVASNYGYDAFGRLASLAHDAAGTANDLTLSFGYNPAGQIVSRSASNDGYVYTPSVAATNYGRNGLNRITDIGGASVSYDGNGNATSIAGNAYGYDAANRLTSATVGGASATFAFDALGRLSGKTAGGVSARFQYAGDQMVAEYDGAGAVTRRHIPGLGIDGVVASYDGAGTSSRSWLLADERGSVLGQSGATGSVTAVNRYDEYGVPAPGNTGRFQYTGQAWLPEAGAYHYRARTYLPQIGRFLQPDPIGYEAGQNLYAYVRGDPLNLVDPSGLQDLRPGDWVTPDQCRAGGGSVTEQDGTLVCLLPPVTLPGGGIGQPGFGTGSGGGSRRPTHEQSPSCARSSARSNASQGVLGGHVTNTWRWDSVSALQHDQHQYGNDQIDAEFIDNFLTVGGGATTGASLAARQGLGGSAARLAGGPLLGAGMFLVGVGAEFEADYKQDLVDAIQDRLDEIEDCGV